MPAVMSVTAQIAALPTFVAGPEIIDASDQEKGLRSIEASVQFGSEEGAREAARLMMADVMAKIGHGRVEDVFGWSLVSDRTFQSRRFYGDSPFLTSAKRAAIEACVADFRQAPVPLMMEIITFSSQRVRVRWGQRKGKEDSGLLFEASMMIASPLSDETKPTFFDRSALQVYLGVG